MPNPTLTIKQVHGEWNDAFQNALSSIVHDLLDQGEPFRALVGHVKEGEELTADVMVFAVTEGTIHGTPPGRTTALDEVHEFVRIRLEDVCSLEVL